MISVLQLGTFDYSTALRLQQKLVEALLEQQSFAAAMSYIEALRKSPASKAVSQYLKGRLALGREQASEALPLLQDAVQGCRRIFP